MFRALCLIWLLTCVLASQHAEAAGAGCDTGLPFPLAVSPTQPDSTQQVTINIDTSDVVVDSVSTEVHDATIDITLTIVGISPPPAHSPCASQVVGPLGPGSYTINLKEVDSGLSQSDAITVASMSFVVGEIPGVSCDPDSGYISVSPSNPADGQAITLTVGRTQAILPESVIVERLGDSITATLTANVNDFSVALPDSCARIEIGALPIGTYTVDLDFVDTTQTHPQAVHVKSTSFTVVPHPPSPPGPLTGLWWNSSQPGWGIDFVQRRDVLFSAWFTYDTAGRPKWYVAPDCELQSVSTGHGCTGDLFEVKGPILLAGLFNPAAVVATKVGTLDLGFADSNTGSMTYTLDGQTRTVSIAREPLRTGPTADVDYSDLWWNPAESGWGMTLTQQSNVMFLALYVYDGGGAPVWYVASDCEVNSAGNGCTGTLYRTSGPDFGAAFDSSKVRAFAVGTASVSFSDQDTGVLTYTVNGAATTKAITREFF